MDARPKILAVDDDRLIRLELRLLLGREGFDVDTAATRTEARDFLRARHYDLVLTDLDLPDTNGLEVLRDVKRFDPTTRVILLTGSSTMITSGEAQAAGAQLLLLKPFGTKELVDSVRRALPMGLMRRGPGTA